MTNITFTQVSLATPVDMPLTRYLSSILFRELNTTWRLMMQQRLSYIGIDYASRRYFCDISGGSVIIRRQHVPGANGLMDDISYKTYCSEVCRVHGEVLSHPTYGLQSSTINMDNPTPIDLSVPGPTLNAFIKSGFVYLDTPIKFEPTADGTMQVWYNVDATTNLREMIGCSYKDIDGWTHWFSIDPYISTKSSKKLAEVIEHKHGNATDLSNTTGIDIAIDLYKLL